MNKLFIILLLPLVVMSGCATLSGTMKKPPLYVEYNYPYKDVWLVMANVMATQSLVFMNGSIETKDAMFMKQDEFGIPLVCVYLKFDDISDKITRVTLRYNSDGSIVFFNLKNKAKFLLETTNNNLMLRKQESKPRTYTIENLDEWYDHYVMK